MVHKNLRASPCSRTTLEHRKFNFKTSAVRAVQAQRSSDRGVLLFSVSSLWSVSICMAHPSTVSVPDKLRWLDVGLALYPADWSCQWLNIPDYPPPLQKQISEYPPVQIFSMKGGVVSLESRSKCRNLESYNSWISNFPLSGSKRIWKVWSNANIWKVRIFWIYNVLGYART